MFGKLSINYEQSAAPKSDLYRDMLALINSNRIRLLDNPKLVNQLCGLERRVSRGGRDSIDHGPGGHDDIANASLDSPRSQTNIRDISATGVVGCEHGRRNRNRSAVCPRMVGAHQRRRRRQ
jgi:hypothetical protein